jgi:probable F420-dependent oxidoreductase
MQFGVMFANTGHGASPDGAIRLAQAAEAGGFDTLWTVEHVVVPSGYESRYPYDPSGKMAGGAEDFDLPDPLVWLTWVAAHTERIRLGTGILILPQRNPVITAKEVATIDHLSGGRMVLGVGSGWLAEEFAALSVPFVNRGDRLDEYIRVMRTLWTEDQASFEGIYHRFERCILRPKPVRGTVPIVVGGHTPRAARRAGRLGDGFFPGNASAREIADLLAVMRTAAEEAGRDPAAIEVIAGAGAPPGDALDRRLEALAEMGVHQAILPPHRPDHLAELGTDLTRRFG